MDVYKLKKSDWEELPLNKRAFEESTGKDKPWYANNRGGDEATFAVCPGCDNPILILGFERKLAHTDKPYARHYRWKVDNLAEYRQWAYDHCPYSRSQRYNPHQRRPVGDELGDKILDILVPNFDRVVYLLEKDTGFKISAKLARQMLTDYRDRGGHLYMGATLQNIPWIFAYMTLSKSLIGRIVHNDQALLDAINTHNAPGIFIEPEGNQIKWKPGTGASLNVCFIHHEARVTDQHLTETMTMMVSSGHGPEAERIYRKTIEFDRDHFKNLINVSPEKAVRPRREELVGLAEEILGTR
ncbi:hypothetical protein [Carnimonas bestiolae]|uniref:hypothetical protein n=1 Tax=Carnimonas bestiolae TaxID=3402172 RepID=UPI003EDC8A1A